MFNAMRNPIHWLRRSALLVLGGLLGLGLPVMDHPVGLPAAYAHHGGGGGGSSGGGSSGASGGGGGGSSKPGTMRQIPEPGYGKGGRGPQGMKP